jgi:hypothetical protein
MASDYKKKTQSDNAHLANLTSARMTHVDGSVTTPVELVPAGVGCRLLRVILATNGNTLRVRTGSRQLSNIASDAPEQTFNYGGYCEDGLIYEAGGAISATIVWEK